MWRSPTGPGFWTPENVREALPIERAKKGDPSSGATVPLRHRILFFPIAGGADPETANSGLKQRGL